QGQSFYNVWTQFAVGDSNKQSGARIPDEIAIRSYRIDVQVKPPTNLQASAKIDIDVQRGGSRALLFELSRYLKVTSVSTHEESLDVLQNQAVEGTPLDRRGDDLVTV